MIVPVLYFAGAAIASVITFLIYHSAVKNQSVSLLEKLQQQTISQNLLLHEKQELQIVKKELIAKAARVESRIGFLEEKFLQQKKN